MFTKGPKQAGWYPTCFCFPGYFTTIKDTIGTVLVKAGNHGFYQYRSGCVYLSLVGPIQ